MASAVRAGGIGPKYADLTVQLTGIDGNAFMVLGVTCKAMRRFGVPPQEIKAFQDEATSGDYDHLIQTVMRWVDVA
jgi:hypothetical protein